MKPPSGYVKKRSFDSELPRESQDAGDLQKKRNRVQGCLTRDAVYQSRGIVGYIVNEKHRTLNIEHRTSNAEGETVETVETVDGWRCGVDTKMVSGVRWAECSM